MTDVVEPAAAATPPTQAAFVVGKVEYREGDGQNIAIRPGPVQVETTEVDATLSWTDGETHGSAAMPIGDFKRLVVEGKIKWAA